MRYMKVAVQGRKNDEDMGNTYVFGLYDSRNTEVVHEAEADDHGYKLKKGSNGVDEKQASLFEGFMASPAAKDLLGMFEFHHHGNFHESIEVIHKNGALELELRFFRQGQRSGKVTLHSLRMGVATVCFPVPGQESWGITHSSGAVMVEGHDMSRFCNAFIDMGW
ncbi:MULTISPECIES: hypothetical protein [unclassified Pseudomonas]|uniref:hypothetical protein n=1 Tax=unclassified Pseudomonas TaxID=196821 RepID=UPI002892D9EE|nr:MULTISPECIES: hypothetical protein [unclassified Pseudomonas]